MIRQYTHIRNIYFPFRGSLCSILLYSQRSHNDDVVEQLNDVKSNSASVALLATSQQGVGPINRKNKEFASSSGTCQPFSLIIG